MLTHRFNLMIQRYGQHQARSKMNTTHPVPENVCANVWISKRVLNYLQGRIGFNQTSEAPSTSAHDTLTRDLGGPINAKWCWCWKNPWDQQWNSCAMGIMLTWPTWGAVAAIPTDLVYEPSLPLVLGSPALCLCRMPLEILSCKWDCCGNLTGMMDGDKPAEIHHLLNSDATSKIQHGSVYQASTIKILHIPFLHLKSSLLQVVLQ